MAQDAECNEQLQLLNEELVVYYEQTWTMHEELEEMQQTQEQASQYYADLYFRAPFAYLILDKNGLVLDLNEGAAVLLGVQPSALRHAPFVHCVTQEDQRAFLDHMRHCRQSSERVTCQFHLRSRSGRVFDAQLSSHPDQVSWHHGPIYRTVIEDRTETLQVQGENQRLAREARRAQIMNEAKDRFLATLGHELRNPLATLSNVALLLKRNAAVDERTQRLHDMLSKQVQHMIDLVDDLQDMSRVVRGKVMLTRHPQDVRQVVRDALDTLQSQTETKHQALSAHLPEEPVWVQADPFRLRQVFINLLSNAHKYTDPNGEIWIRVERAENEVVIYVKDTGIGIPPQHLESIFEPFLQAEITRSTSSTPGLGIGLSLAKRLVELHGGTIQAASQGPGLGSEFQVRLPLYMPGSDVAAEAPATETNTFGSPPPVSSSGRGTKTLIVDDNQALAETFAQALRLNGFDTLTAYDGASAIEMVRRHEPTAILLDIGMPGMDGFQVMRELRQQHLLPGKRVAVITGYGQEVTDSTIHKLEIQCVFIKPVDLQEVEQFLSQAEN